MPPKNQHWWLTTDKVDTVIDASPEALYDLVADMPRMGEWSPECQAVEWVDGATEAVADARFVGHNRTGPRGLIKWSRNGRVLTAERGEDFAFCTEEGGSESTIWRYQFEATDGGTRVTESYDVTWIPTWARIGDVVLNRHKDLLKNMAKMLAQLKTAAEAKTATV